MKPMYQSLNDAAELCPSLAAGKTRIWYVKPNYFGAAVTETLIVNPKRLDETHILLGEVSGDDLEVLFHNLLEVLFHDLQGDFWSPNGEARDLIVSKGLNHTSMSVGDVIETTKGIFICSMMGWQKLEKEVLLT